MGIKSQNYNFEWIKDLSGIMFPNICVACGGSLHKTEREICFRCLSNLPKTHLHRAPNNIVSRKFHGRLPVYQAASFLTFARGSHTRALIHLLKYRGCREIGERLGELYAFDLMADGFDPPDVIVPLPLHADKLKIRGYNQCDPIAVGLNKNFHSRVDFKNVVRVNNNATQTRKGRWERWKNVEHIFKVLNPEPFRGRHVLLVDDVVTTGATLEACGKVILEAGVDKLSILTLALA